jgi:hypothetical protein
VRNQNIWYSYYWDIIILDNHASDVINAS